MRGYHSLYRWPQDSPHSGGANDEAEGGLAEVHTASFFLYGEKRVVIDDANLLDQSLAIDVAQLG